MRHCQTTWIFGFVLPLLTAGSQAANQVLVVDADGGSGVDFPILQDAIDSAGDGDIILLRETMSTLYSANITGKSLTIQADPPGASPIMHGLTIAGVSANQKVVLRGLRTNPSFLFGVSAISVDACTGLLLVEDCQFITGAVITPDLANVVGSQRVVFTRCIFQGSAGSTSELNSTGPRAGLRIQNSTVALYDCSITGGKGAMAAMTLFSGLIFPAQDGAPGVMLDSGSLFVSGGSVSGGDGGNGSILLATCQPSGDGGSGIRVNSGSLTRLDVVITGGVAGIDPVTCPQVGVPGVDIELVSGTANTINDVARSLAVSSPAHEGQLVTTTVTGKPGEDAILLLAFAPGGNFAPALKGVLIGGGPLSAIVLGPLPPTGVLAFQVTIPVGGLSAGVEGIDLYEQVLVAGAAGNGLLSSPSVVAIVQ